MSPDDPRHGRPSGYDAGCREACCRAAAAAYEQRRRYDAILGLPPRTQDATGTTRRIQALVAIGYTFREIGEGMGVSHDRARSIATRPTKFVRTSTANAVADLFERWCMTPAPESWSASYARTTARRNKWAPPLAWLDIDDPDEQPDLGEIKHDSRGRPVVRDALIEDAEWLADDDLHLDVVVERLGVTRANFHAACRRAGRLDLYHRLARRLPYGAGEASMTERARRTA